MATPQVSIITATYNSPHLLQYAIKSVLRSDFQDWELIVVGDCCTDNTEQVVNSFGDPRIRFYNLESNSGQQATPNNFGIAHAQGDYLAFLNQDDMYFPDHLSQALSQIRESGADILCVPYYSIRPSTPEQLAAGDYGIDLFGVPPFKKYSPYLFYLASGWFLKRSLAEKVGPWLTENKVYVTPSQEWLFRANKLGVQFAFGQVVTVLVIMSGPRPNSYKKKESFEHQYFFDKIQAGDPGILVQLGQKAAITGATKIVQIKYYEPGKRFLGALIYPIYKILEAFSIHPFSLDMIIRWGGKGKFVKNVRRKTGLPQ